MHDVFKNIKNKGSSKNHVTGVEEGRVNKNFENGHPSVMQSFSEWNSNNLPRKKGGGGDGESIFFRSRPVIVRGKLV